MSFICMTYIGVGANLKPVNIYTERPTHMNCTIYHAKLIKPTPKPYKPKTKQPKSCS